VVAETKEALREKLAGWLSGAEEREGVYSARSGKERETLSLFGTDDGLREAVRGWQREGRYERLLSLWVKGLPVEWEDFYQGVRVQRQHLPVYPFSGERYWHDEGVGVKEPVGRQHPLLHGNTSDINGLRYSSTFYGRERFLSDHQVNGEKMMPAVVHLEIARAAAHQAIPHTQRDRVVISDVTWIRPLIAEDSPVQMHISLFQEQDEEVFYEINGDDRDAQASYSQGHLAMVETPEDIPMLDIPLLQAECAIRTVTGAECYQLFAQMGIIYGPGFQGLDTLYIGDKQLLARIHMPAWEEQEAYFLHPGVIDAALQATIGLVSQVQGERRTWLPFAVDEVAAIRTCQQEMWAWVKLREENDRTAVECGFDLILCDDNGEVCVAMTGVRSRIRRMSGEPTSDSGKNGDNITLLPRWEAVPASEITHADPIAGVGWLIETQGIDEDTPARQQWRDAVAARCAQLNIVTLEAGESIEGLTRRLKNVASPDQIFWRMSAVVPASTEDTRVQRQRSGVLCLFRLIKALLALGYEARPLHWSLLTVQAVALNHDEMNDPTHAGVHGFAGCLAKEFPGWSIRLVDIERSEVLPALALTLPDDEQGQAWLIRRNEAYRQKLVPLRGSLEHHNSAYKENGVYVVLGGAGGIGEVWSEYMITKYAARIIWLGRRALDDGIRDKQRRLGTLGQQPDYLQADATDPAALGQACGWIKERYGEINGIVHAAIVLCDQSLIKMTESRFLSGLSSKVDTCVNLAQAFRETTPDFVLYFSSMQSFSCSAGQSN
ncbi:MAG: SDR family oxidoreductase, partial [Enterobacter roggenkampii]